MFGVACCLVGIAYSHSQTPLIRYTERAKETVRTNGVSVLSGLNLEKMKGLSFPRGVASCPAAFDFTLC